MTANQIDRRFMALYTVTMLTFIGALLTFYHYTHKTKHWLTLCNENIVVEYASNKPLIVEQEETMCELLDSIENDREVPFVIAIEDPKGGRPKYIRIIERTPIHCEVNTNDK